MTHPDTPPATNPVPRPFGMDMDAACDWVGAVVDLVHGFRTNAEAEDAGRYARRGLTPRQAADEILHTRGELSSVLRASAAELRQRAADMAEHERSVRAADDAQACADFEAAHDARAISYDWQGRPINATY
jgi:hypothetical protein